MGGPNLELDASGRMLSLYFFSGAGSRLAIDCSWWHRACGKGVFFDSPRSGRSVAESAPASMPVQDVAVRSHLGPLGDGRNTVVFRNSETVKLAVPYFRLNALKERKQREEEATKKKQCCQSCACSWCPMFVYFSTLLLSTVSDISKGTEGLFAVVLGLDEVSIGSPWWIIRKKWLTRLGSFAPARRNKPNARLKPW